MTDEGKRVTTGIRWGKKHLCRSDRWPRGNTTCLVLKSGVAISYTQERESLFSSAGLHKDLLLLQNQLQGLHTRQSLPTHVMNDMGSTKSALSPASLNRRHFCYHIYWGNIKIQIVWFKKEVGHLLLSCTIHTFFCKQPAKPDVRWSQLKDGPRTDEEQVRLGFHTEGGRCSISKQALLDLGIPALVKETRLGYNLRTSSGSRLAWGCSTTTWWTVTLYPKGWGCSVISAISP